MRRQDSKFDGKKMEDFLEWSFKFRASLSLYNKPASNILQGLQRSSELDNDQATAREALDDAKHNLYNILHSTTTGPAFSVGLTGGTPRNENGKDAVGQRPR